MPELSVIMPAYNAEKYILDSIQSVLRQTFTDFEFIIINDSSTDQTEKIINSFQDKRIVYLRNENNLGISKSLNKGLDLAKGNLIARMDADDISFSSRFEKQVDYLREHQDIDVLGTRSMMFGENMNETPLVLATEPEQIKIDSLFFCPITHPSVMFRKELVQEGYQYNPEFDGCEDYELWTRIMQKHKIASLSDVLLKYRVHSSQISSQPSTKSLSHLSLLKKSILDFISVDYSNEEFEAFIEYTLHSENFDFGKILFLQSLFDKIYKTNMTTNYYSQKKLGVQFFEVLSNLIKLYGKEQTQISLITLAKRYNISFYRSIRAIIKYSIKG